MIEWTPETIRIFVGGCVLGAFITSMISLVLCTGYIDHETKRMQEKYASLRSEWNDLYRKNKKLIAFIKERRWE